MATDRGKQLLLGALLVVLAVAGYRALARTSPAPGSASKVARAEATAPAGGRSGIAAPDVHLDALDSERPKPVAAERNLFRFKAKTAPPPAPTPTTGGRAGRGAPTAAPAATGPPPPPPIGLKFIGRIEREGKPTIAILSDGQGPPLYGIEGGTVNGRYRILKIGVESIEIAYLDGRGRQTIRLTGS